jgi:hypothetical protein
MARYSAFLGRRVEVQYRAGDILLPASGTFVADSGRSIFLEQHLEQRGQEKYFRWEIPYQYIVRLEEKKDPTAGAVPCTNGQAGVSSAVASRVESQNSVTVAGRATCTAPALLPPGNRHKTS